MADTATRAKPRADPLFLKEEHLRQAIELLFFAYREFTDCLLYTSPSPRDS